MLYNDLIVYVFTSDKYIRAVRTFAFLFNRHWSINQRVQVVGFAEPDFELPENFSFMSLGLQKKYPWHKWSNALLDMMDDMPGDETFCLMLEDYWITRGVDIEAIDLLYKHMNEDDSIIKICLTGDRLYAGGMTDYGSLGRLDLIKSAYDSPYHLSLMAGLWRRNLLYRVLVSNESPHDVEINGTSRLAELKDEVKVLGTRQWPLRHILGHRGGDPSETFVQGIHEDDLSDLRLLGYV